VANTNPTRPGQGLKILAKHMCKLWHRYEMVCLTNGPASKEAGRAKADYNKTERKFYDAVDAVVDREAVYRHRQLH